MGTYSLIISGTPYLVSIKNVARDRATVEVNDVSYEVQISGGLGSAPPAAASASPQPVAAPKPHPPGPAWPATVGGSGEIRAPMPGLITKVLVKVGDKVRAGDKVMCMEAMKMENDIYAPVNGTVKEVTVQDGKEVQEGQILLIIG